MDMGAQATCDADECMRDVRTHKPAQARRRRGHPKDPEMQNGVAMRMHMDAYRCISNVCMHIDA